jgi:DNA-binding XRE family transcriptional regulator
MENQTEFVFNHEAWREARPKALSRRKLAKAVGTSDSNLFYIENGKSKPSWELAFRYCAYVHLPLENLCLQK